ncbi:hypothetical protein D3C77_13380 [compost metagenome]
MSKEFKKGQEVVYFHDWDRKGTWFFRRAVVMSCGAKKMTLAALDGGEMMGRNFRPDSTHLYTVPYQGKQYERQHADCTLPTMSDEEAHAMCIKLAEGTLAQERRHYEMCISGNHGEAYTNSMRRDLALLHEARSREYADRAN